MAFGPAIRVPSDASAALWIAPTLGSFGTVGGLVPQGYERYLLFDYRGGEPRGWDGVCRLFEQLVPVLARQTSTPNHCWFAIWEGYGFDTSMTLVAAMPRDDEERRDVERQRQRLREDDAKRNKSIRTALSRLPSFDLPNRRYYLVCGAVAAASEIERPDGKFRQPPDLCGQRIDGGSSAATPILTGATSGALSGSSLPWPLSSRARHGLWTGRRRTPQSVSSRGSTRCAPRRVSLVDPHDAGGCDM